MIIKVVNVENPIPGEWNVKATSDSAHSVRLTAISDIVFNFGFSLKTPQKIAETFFNPLQSLQIIICNWSSKLIKSFILDELNVLSISPSNNTLIHNLTSVQISLFYDKNEQPQKPFSFTLNLKKIAGTNETDDLYITQPFQPPRQPFKIDVKSNEFKVWRNNRNSCIYNFRSMDSTCMVMHYNVSYQLWFSQAKKVCYILSIWFSDLHNNYLQLLPKCL